ncbi:MAG: hypothetical protein ACXWWC_04745 [Chitinophagaceae bacterium]
MKRVVQLIKFSCIVLLCGGLMISCRKTNVTPEDPVNPGDSTNAKADTISNHLKFFGSIKKKGTIPKGPAGSSLEMSFKDTLYLQDELKSPIKFLHKDTTKDVAGIYVQVHIGDIGKITNASYYYDAPETPEMEESDTVSVIMIGIDPDGLGLPLDFDITITPYDESGQPLGEANRPVKVNKPKVDPAGNAGSCGLVLQSGEHWEWVLSVIQAASPAQSVFFDFYSDPYKVFEAEGQFIKGSCCNGYSVYGKCPGQSTTNSQLHFATYYQIMLEWLTFNDDGTFFRQTFEASPIPAPSESDFCGGGEGIVKPKVNHTTYDGNWTIHPATLPPDLQLLAWHDSLSIDLQQTSPYSGGYGNPGGIIHQLDCHTLVLIQPDPEGLGQHLYKFYSRVSLNLPWYPFG